MENTILIALLTKLIDEKISQLPPPTGARGPRGQVGRRGQPGKDFDLSEHEETIRAWAKEFALKFEDLTAEEIESLRGIAGPKGKDGKDFVFAEHEEAIRAWAKEFALKFDDLNADEIEAIRGKSGRDGLAGKDFCFEDSKDKITEIIASTVEEMSEGLKLKFSDLSEDEIEQLRGYRGRDGRDGNDGRDFDFEEHREFFESLKLRFTDLTDEERNGLKLKVSDLEEEEKIAIQTALKEFAAEELRSLRGPRGSRGQRGAPGKDGTNGLSIRGLPGLPGISGRNGKDGRDGEDGKDAPYIVDIELDLNEVTQEIALVTIFSDGTEIRSNSVELPKASEKFIFSGGGGGGGGSGGGSALTVQDEGSDLSTAVTKINFVGTGVVATETSPNVIEVNVSGGGSSFDEDVLLTDNFYDVLVDNEGNILRGAS